MRLRASRGLAIVLLAPFFLSLAPRQGIPAQPRRFSPEELSRHLQSVKRIEVELLRLGASKHFARARAARARARKPARGSGARPAPPPVSTSDRAPAPPAPTLTSATPSNVKINQSAGDAFSATQSEVSLAALGTQVVAAWNDGQGSFTGGAYQGYAWSVDGGLTWVDGGDPPRPPAYPQFRWTSDPVITVNEKTGVFFYCAMANTESSRNGIAVARGSFQGGSFAWSDVQVVRDVSNLTAFLDKPWIAADSSGAGGSLYLTYTTFTHAGNQIDLQRSADGGTTWSNSVKLSSAADNGLVQASRPAVGPGGELYVLWYAIGQGVPEDFLRVRRSLDRGQSFAAQVTVAGYIANFGTGAPGFNRERGIHFPSLAVDRTSGAYRGRAYVAWTEAYNFQDDPLGAGAARVEVEPNGFGSAATPFAPGDVLRGVTAGPSDLDHWSFPLAEGASIVVWADSLPSGQTYALRIFPSGADSASSLCFGGDITANSSVNQAFYTFTAPVTDTYLLRMGPLDANSVAGGYRIRTGAGQRDAERGRDQRDVFASWSDDGMVWSAPARINDDKPGLDDFLAEIAVGSDGAPYALWFDFRDQLHGATGHQYLSRSMDGGASWDANQRITTTATNWTFTRSNLAPNMGDYDGLWSSDGVLHAGWADGRDGTADVYGAALALGHSVTACAADAPAMAGGSVSLSWTVGSQHPLYANAILCSVSPERAWPVPEAALIVVPAEGAAQAAFEIQVPDSAAPGPVAIVFEAANAPGALAARCTTVVEVTGSLAVRPGEASLDLGPGVPNPASERTAIRFTLPAAGKVALRVYGARGERIRTLVEGELPAGGHVALWDGRNDRGDPVPAGAYFCRLETGRGTLSRRLVWIP